MADVPWTGVRLSDLLDEAGVGPGATHLRIWSFDGAYTESLTLDQARRGDVIAAHRMQDGPVTREHGGPVRLYVGPMYGYKSLKWLERIEVVDALHEGYWEVRGLRRRRLGRPLQRPRRRADVVIERFGTPTRALHWATAVTVLTCALTGLVLYVGPLSAVVGRRNLVKDVHVIAGLAMPVPWSWPTPGGGGPRSAASSAAWPGGAGPTAAGCGPGVGRPPTTSASSTPARSSTPPSSPA